ncbi:MAG TPA: ABC transporter permease [Candidatus Dormibacteraeota bacterium]|nr:ABC transporter permease [Candidatus Dormibacteraeota bacterium]
MDQQLRPLLAKELLQVRRSKGATLSATLLPILLMVVIPLGQAVATRGAPAGVNVPAGVTLPPGLAAVTTNPSRFFVEVLLPLYLALGGLIVPAISATYTVVAEREKRSLELILALPVRLRDILVAKLLAMLILALVVVLPLFAVDAATLLALGLVSWPYLALLFAVLAASLVCSTGIALVLALLARDFRTANNLNGAMIGPLIIVMLGILFGVPGAARIAALAAFLLFAGSAAFIVGLRWLTFERYLA